MADTDKDGDDMGSVELVEAAGAEVLEPGERTLAELAETINREYRDGLEHAAEAIEHWVRCGEALLEARDRCAPGMWTAWMEQNLDIAPGTVRQYVRIARYANVLRSASEPVLSIVQARRLLAGLPDASPRRESNVPEEIKERARRLHEDGMSSRAIADLVGHPRSTVDKWINPERWRKHNALLLRRQQERRTAAAALREKEREQAIKRAVKKAGAATAEAWQMAERMQDVLAQAHRETEDREARRALSEAGVHYRKMRDEIVRALGVS